MRLLSSRSAIPISANMASLQKNSSHFMSLNKNVHRIYLIDSSADVLDTRQWIDSNELCIDAPFPQHRCTTLSPLFSNFFGFSDLFFPRLVQFGYKLFVHLETFVHLCVLIDHPGWRLSAPVVAGFRLGKYALHDCPCTTTKKAVNSFVIQNWENCSEKRKRKLGIFLNSFVF